MFLNKKLQPVDWGDHLPSGRCGQHGWDDLYDRDGTQLGGVSRAPNANPQPSDNNSLTHQISEQLRNAVNKGYIRVEFVTQQLSPGNISMLNQLLQKVSRLEQALQEIEHLRMNVHNTGLKTEYVRLVLEVEQLKLEMEVMQNKISVSLQMSGPPDELEQWKKSSVEWEYLETLVSALTVDTEDGEQTECSSERNEFDMCKNDKDGPLGIPGLPYGIQEFVPGKQWEWVDPSKVSYEASGFCYDRPECHARITGSDACQVTYMTMMCSVDIRTNPHNLVARKQRRFP